MRERHSLENEITRLLPSIGQSRAKKEEPCSPEGEANPVLTGLELERNEIIHVYVVREGEEE